MRILILSDSHQVPLDDLQISKYDAVIHCGDYGKSLPFLLENHIYFVKGNCDTFGKTSEILNLFGRVIFVTHGYLENVKFNLDSLVYRAYEVGASICLFGHTHQMLCFQEENVLFINPGAYPEGFAEITEDEIILHQGSKVKHISYRW